MNLLKTTEGTFVDRSKFFDFFFSSDGSWQIKESIYSNEQSSTVTGITSIVQKNNNFTYSGGTSFVKYTKMNQPKTKRKTVFTRNLKDDNHMIRNNDSNPNAANLSSPKNDFTFSFSKNVGVSCCQGGSKYFKRNLTERGNLLASNKIKTQFNFKDSNTKNSGINYKSDNASVSNWENGPTIEGVTISHLKDSAKKKKKKGNKIRMQEGEKTSIEKTHDFRLSERRAKTDKSTSSDEINSPPPKQLKLEKLITDNNDALEKIYSDSMSSLTEDDYDSNIQSSISLTGNNNCNQNKTKMAAFSDREAIIDKEGDLFVSVQAQHEQSEFLKTITVEDSRKSLKKLATLEDSHEHSAIPKNSCPKKDNTVINQSGHWDEENLRKNTTYTLKKVKKRKPNTTNPCLEEVLLKNMGQNEGKLNNSGDESSKSKAIMVGKKLHKKRNSCNNEKCFEKLLAVENIGQSFNTNNRTYISSSDTVQTLDSFHSDSKLCPNKNLTYFENKQENKRKSEENKKHGNNSPAKLSLLENIDDTLYAIANTSPAKINGGLSKNDSETEISSNKNATPDKIEQEHKHRKFKNGEGILSLDVPVQNLDSLFTSPVNNDKDIFENHCNSEAELHKSKSDSPDKNGQRNRKRKMGNNDTKAHAEKLSLSENIHENDSRNTTPVKGNGAIRLNNCEGEIKSNKYISPEKMQQTHKKRKYREKSIEDRCSKEILSLEDPEQDSNALESISPTNNSKELNVNDSDLDIEKQLKNRKITSSSNNELCLEELPLLEKSHKHLSVKDKASLAENTININFTISNSNTDISSNANITPLKMRENHNKIKSKRVKECSEELLSLEDEEHLYTLDNASDSDREIGLEENATTAKELTVHEEKNDGSNKETRKLLENSDVKSKTSHINLNSSHSDTDSSFSANIAHINIIQRDGESRNNSETKITDELLIEKSHIIKRIFSENGLKDYSDTQNRKGLTTEKRNLEKKSSNEVDIRVDPKNSLKTNIARTSTGEFSTRLPVDCNNCNEDVRYLVWNRTKNSLKENICRENNITNFQSPPIRVSDPESIEGISKSVPVTSTPYSLNKRRKTCSKLVESSHNDYSHNRNEHDGSSSSIEEILDDIQSQIIASDSELEMLKNLDIKIDWKLSPLHEIDSGSAKMSMGKLKSKLDTTLLNTKKFLKEEEELIIHNWKSFSEKYQFDNPQLFFPSKQNFGVFSRKERYKFKLFLAKDLPNRRLHSVYSKFVDIFGVKSRGRWSDKEDRLLLKLYHDYNEDREQEEDDDEFSQVSKGQIKFGMPRKIIIQKALDRSWMSIHRRLQILLQNDQARALSQRDIRWTPELEGEVIYYLLKKSKVSSLEELRYSTITYRVWHKVVTKLNLHLEKMINRWKYHLYPQLFARQPVMRHELNAELIKWFYQSDIHDWKDIDWSDISRKAGDLGSCFLYRCFRTLVGNCVPKRFRRTFRDSVVYLHEDYLEDLLEKDNSSKIRMIVRKRYDPVARILREVEEDEMDCVPFRIR